MLFLTGASALFCNYLQCQAPDFSAGRGSSVRPEGVRAAGWCPATPAKRQHGLGMMTEVSHSLAIPRHDHKPWAQLGSLGDCEFPGVVLGKRLLEMWFCPATLYFLLLLWSTTFKYHLKYLSFFAYRNYKTGYFVFRSSPKVSLLFTHQKNESLFNKYSLESNFIISKSRPVWMGQVIKKKKKKGIFSVHL